MLNRVLFRIESKQLHFNNNLKPNNYEKVFTCSFGAWRNNDDGL